MPQSIQGQARDDAIEELTERVEKLEEELKTLKATPAGKPGAGFEEFRAKVMARFGHSLE
jgi:chaperonin cofactor prefoldin